MCGPASPRRAWICTALAYSVSIPTISRLVSPSDGSVGPIARIAPAACSASWTSSAGFASPLAYWSPHSPSAVMFVRPSWMNCRSVAEHVCARAGFARPLATSESATVTMARRPAAARPIRRTLRFSARIPRLSSLFPGVCSEDERPVRDRLPHPDRLVHADRRGVLGANEQAHHRHELEQEPAEIAHPALRVPVTPHLRVHPDLLELHGRRRPRRRLGLEQDRAVVPPQPRAAVLDLHPRPPAEALGIAPEGVDSDLLAVGSRARGNEQVEVVLRRAAQARVARLWRLLEHVDRLAGPVLARSGQPAPQCLPELGDRALLSDHHARVPGRSDVCETGAPAPGRDDIRAGMTESLEASAPLDRREAPEAAPGHVLEEDALDRVLGAKRQDLVEPGLLQRGHRAEETLRRCLSWAQTAVHPRRCVGRSLRQSRRDLF